MWLEKSPKLSWETLGFQMDHFPFWFTIQLHRQMGWLSIKNAGREECASQHCCCWNSCRNKMWKYLHLLKCYRHKQFFLSAVVKHSLQKPTCLSNNWERSNDSQTSTFGGFKKIVEQSRVPCHGRIRGCVIGAATVLPSPFLWCNYFCHV